MIRHAKGPSSMTTTSATGPEKDHSGQEHHQGQSPTEKVQRGLLPALSLSLDTSTTTSAVPYSTPSPSIALESPTLPEQSKTPTQEMSMVVPSADDSDAIDRKKVSLISYSPQSERNNDYAVPNNLQKRDQDQIARSALLSTIQELPVATKEEAMHTTIADATAVPTTTIATTEEWAHINPGHQPMTSKEKPPPSSRILHTQDNTNSSAHANTIPANEDRDNGSTCSRDNEGADVAMSMASPIKHSKSPPISSCSSTSGAKKSSMILHGGTLSPAWSMTSIPRDISAAYQTQQPLSSEPGLDEKLFGLVDRYGFLVEDGRTPTAEKNSEPSRSTRGPVRSAETIKQAKLIQKEQERSLKWAKMATRHTSRNNEIEYSFPFHQQFVSRVYKGIPDCWRAAAWTYLIDRRSGNFDATVRERYEKLCDTSSPEEEQIDLDIPRTMHGHIMFKERYGPGQCALFHVLKAYSNYDRQVGYCQGMASVVATMLTFFDQEKTFVLLVQLFERYNINNLVIPGFPALFEAFYIQEGLTKRFAPKVFKALETMGIATPSYASRWYITLYSAGVVPYRTLLRIWDIFLLEGFEWLYFMAIALLKYHEAALVQNNFEQTMEMLNAKMNIQDDDLLIKIAHRFFRKARHSGIVAQLKKEYLASQPTDASSRR